MKSQTSQFPQGPYVRRERFLRNLRAQYLYFVDNCLEAGEVPAEVPGALEFNLRVLRALKLNAYLKNRYPDPLQEELKALFAGMAPHSGLAARS
jgi:hypothetical protein